MFRRKREQVAGKLQTLTDARLALCLPSIGELWHMVFKSARVESNTAELELFLVDYDHRPYDLAAAREFGRIKSELRAAGRPIPDVDSQIAAIARVNDLVLLSADAHFEQVRGRELACRNAAVIVQAGLPESILMASGGDDPLDYAPPPSAKRSSPTWCGVADARRNGHERNGAAHGFRRRRPGGPFVVCIVGAAIRLTASPRPPRRPIVVTLYLVGLTFALAMVATATWGLVTGMYL